MRIFGNSVRLLLAVVMAVVLSTCEQPVDHRESIVEANLVRSFRDESPEAQRKIAEIIKDARARNYKIALNKLALFSSSRILTGKQQFQIGATMRVLRYNMEEEIFPRQRREKNARQERQRNARQERQENGSHSSKTGARQE